MQDITLLKDKKTYLFRQILDTRLLSDQRHKVICFLIVKDSYQIKYIIVLPFQRHNVIFRLKGIKFLKDQRHIVIGSLKE